MRRKTLSDAGVAALRPKATRYTFPDPELRGHYIRVTPAGVKSYVAVSRTPAGKQVWTTIAAVDMMPIEKAREAAREAITRIRDGLPATEEKAKPLTFVEVADNYLKRHVEAKALISGTEIKRMLNVYVRPVWGHREFTSIRRGDVADLLDKVEDQNGARQADAVLATIRGICNWFASRDDTYLSPIVRGMKRTDAKARKRARILDDEELRIVWREAEAGGTFGAIVRLALLTAQRREKIASMKWSDVTVDGIWNVDAADREKGTGGALKLPDSALAIIRAQSRVGNNPHVFAGRGDGHFVGWSPCKRSFDRRAAIEPWVVHDLRRTARSLMSRAGVRPDIAERVLGHTIAGVEGVYDRHHYRDEKADALARLDSLIHIILTQSDNVVPMSRASA